MKLWISLGIIWVLCCSCKQEVAELSLNGQWHFLASNEVSEQQLLSEKFDTWDTITVPGNWDTRQKYADYVGKGYYKKQFKVPADWNGSQIRLKFDAVYETSKVWLNGKLLGQHTGGYTPFDFIVTDELRQEGENTLVVMADNSYKRGAWWAWGGISRNVTLIRDNEARLVYQHISATPDFQDEVVHFTIKYKIENNSANSYKLNVQSEITDDQRVMNSSSREVQVQPNSTTVEVVSFTSPLKDYRLWSFNQPQLYQLHTELKTEGQQLDVKMDKFGIRKLEAKGERLYLNNEVVYMNGLNRVHDHPDYGNTEPDALIRRDIMDIKALGGVFSRLMHAPQAVNLLEFCDSVGYLIIEEIPVWGDDDPQTFKDNPLTKQWLKEMIERDFNHPSVVGWSVGNELRDSSGTWAEKTMTKEQFEYVNSMLDYIDELDTSRLKTYVSLTSYKGNASLENEPFEKLDLLCINSYSDGVKAAKATNKKFPGKPIFLSEIGIKQIGPAPDGQLSDKLVNQLNELKTLPFVVGSAVWSYNDYKSNYKGTPASGFREWGVVDERRNKKAAYEQLKQIYSQEKNP